MRVMNDLFQPFIDEFFVYLDDILVFSKSWNENVCHVKKVFDVFKNEKLYVKLSKYDFGKTSLGYLGHIVGHGQLKIDPSKVEAIVNWPKPTSVTDIHSFLGAFQYGRRFIANFSVIAAPLHTLISVKQVFQWGGRQQKSFETLKEKIKTTPVLALPDLQRPFEIKTDTNTYAMGVVVMQQKKPICYHSEKLSRVVINYLTYNKELYALCYHSGFPRSCVRGKYTRGNHKPIF